MLKLSGVPFAGVHVNQADPGRNGDPVDLVDPADYRTAAGREITATMSPPIRRFLLTEFIDCLSNVGGSHSSCRILLSFSRSLAFLPKLTEGGII
jgi:hypothetical protein